MSESVSRWAADAEEQAGAGATGDKEARRHWGVTVHYLAMLMVHTQYRGQTHHTV